MTTKTPIVVVNFPLELIAQLNDVAAQTEAMVAALIIAISNEQRRKTPKMGPKTMVFVTKCFNYAKQTPRYAPEFLDVAGMGSNLAIAAALEPVARRFASLGFDLIGTNMVARISARSAASLIYGRIQEAAENNQPGGQAAYDDLKVQYEHSKREDDEDKNKDDH